MNDRNTPLLWGDKRYHAFNYHLRELFGEKVMKISLNAGLSCPNRDGTISSGGCVFCCPQGSGACAGDPEQAITQQFRAIRERIQKKWPRGKYLAYFQAYTNTYADPAYLKSIYEEALAQEDVVGLSISTRPDCLPEEILDLLAELNKKTYLWVEMGLQSIHDKTLERINRGHDSTAFYEALQRLRSRGIRTCAHIILGLPGESEAEMLQTGQAVADMDIQGLKFHVLHLMKGTALVEDYEAGRFSFLERERYINMVADILEILPPSVVIQRLTGDAPRHLLLGPSWVSNKWQVLQGIDDLLRERHSWQGKNQHF
ncbi:TIGR01212 family radical SAM protein [Heliorestis acidaminivorans]|uniref:TIGR01212 family radical SAM protein n=1 Tax=Heliorestis acidaminivorans TaxID=553427 RepID=A0A6I0EWY0_9FIRM|nr:TIGR01212 family radical SAM protein [Heliorestis acidaminivorans]KAB2952667.1 TIGR01212 family radical SAM protein [Heliorestis acidaminivorans]